MSRLRLCLAIVLGLLFHASGCSSETYVATCTVTRDTVNGAENAKVNDYIANMGRGALVHLDAINESADVESIVVEAGAQDPAFSGNKNDAQILSVDGELLELGVLDDDTAEYLANSNLCRP